MVSPASATPVPGEADACVTVGARFVGVVGEVGAVGCVVGGAVNDPVVSEKFR
jgi:energy-converting hydrogenase Eha subunit E